MLKMDAGVVIGYVTVDSVDVEYFRISTDNSGVVTFKQSSSVNIWSPTPGDSSYNEGASLNLNAVGGDTVAIRLTQTVTDADGDTSSASVDLASSDKSVDVAAFTILDDGPTATLNSGAVATARTDAGTITLTPGTLTAEFSADSKTLLIHALHAPDPDAIRDDIKSRYEARLKRIFA